MKLLIGIGNPGEKYKNSLHNAGALCAQTLNSKFQVSNKLQILISQNFMNDSGKFVSKIIRQSPFSTRDLYIAHDDLDILLGQYKIQFGVGPKVHNGVKSVEEALGTKDFWRIRIGIDSRPTSPAASRGKVEDFVLQDFTKEEVKIL